MSNKPRFISVKSGGGGSLVGYITCSYADLVRTFGEPTESDGYKVSSEWTIKDTRTGQVFHIYDYKETELYSRGLPTVAKFRAQPSYEWHLGGMAKVDVDALRAFIQERSGEMASSAPNGTWQ